MNKRFLAVLGFALVVSLVASTVLYRLVVGKVASASQRTGVPVLVAARDLTVGTMVKAEHLKTVEWSGPVSAQWIQKADEAVNHGVVLHINEGEPVARNRLAASGAGGGMAATIPQGKRAVAVRVDDVVGLAGFVVPGMRVDVIVSGQPPNDPGVLGTQSRTVLQNIEVLSAGQNIQKDIEGKPVTVQVVNLLVSPEQAEILSLASAETRIQLVLRNPLDTEEIKAPGTAKALLFSDKPGGLPATKAPLPLAARAAPRPKEKKFVTEDVVVPVTMEIVTGPKKESSKVGQKIEQRVKEVAQ
ncbi:MAG: Flp pilus assembly protein CpaB [Bryobacter sp.]|nr:Flp pilus assembly protein CpaB [Bryobacter sp.]